jgi:sec-independent protein translocase protein TatA
MIGDLFDSPWKILIVAAVIIVLFGSAKLPAAARSLGKSMRILKTEVAGLHGDDTEPGSVTPALTAAERQAAAEQLAVAEQLATVQQLHAEQQPAVAQAQPAVQRVRQPG